ncbi:hypothetical protein DWZ26_02870 [Ruminococcus sp. AF31-14BH]|nr:hypothetical protein DWZ26_02870 [Ruminococcus sp. AF31-14BH]
MYSKSKQTFYHVRDSLIKHRWLLTAELIWVIVCTFFRNQMQTGQSEHSIYLTVSIEKKNVSATTEGESSICCWGFFYNYPNGYIYWLDF